MEKAPTASPRKRRLVFVLWVFVALLYFYASYDYIRVTSNDRKLGEYLRYVVELAGNDRRSPKEVRDLILVRAEQLELPVSGEQIRINAEDYTLTVAVNYEMDIEFPLLERVLYRKEFQHQAVFDPRR